MYRMVDNAAISGVVADQSRSPVSTSYAVMPLCRPDVSYTYSVDPWTMTVASMPTGTRAAMCNGLTGAGGAAATRDSRATSGTAHHTRRSAIRRDRVHRSGDGSTPTLGRDDGGAELLTSPRSTYVSTSHMPVTHRA